jgi:hypothetical protein
MDMHDQVAALKAFAIELSRDPAEGVSARGRALMACIVIPPEIQKWMVEAGAVEPLLDSIEKTILAAEEAARADAVERLRATLKLAHCVLSALIAPNPQESALHIFAHATEAEAKVRAALASDNGTSK